MLSNIRGCAADGLRQLGLDAAAEPEAVVKALDAFVYRWQKGKRPPPRVLDPQDAPLMFGSLWGEQLVKRFAWQWGMITFHDHNDSSAPAVLPTDRSLAIYPIHFLLGAFRDPGVDATIALSFNMLDAGSVKGPGPRQYLNLMEGVRRIVPRA
jgi:hypothetical protein